MNKFTTLAMLIFYLAAGPVLGDELTLTIEQELTRLGYDAGASDGEESVETMIAIAKYQAEHGYAITGEASEKLSGALAKTTSVGNAPKVRALKPDKRAAVVVSEAGLRAAREACLKNKMLVARATESNGGLNDGLKDEMIDKAARMAIQSTGIGMAQQVYDLYSRWNENSEPGGSKANETSAMAKSLGISEADVNACQTPES